MRASPKQERSQIRTFEQLIRRYDLESLASIQRASENAALGLSKTNATLEKFIIATAGNFENMQSQIDGKISTYFYSGEPTLENVPANEWATTEEKESHLGDLYYDKDTGYAYRFSLVDDAYGWIKSSDAGVAEALAIANAAQDTADGKRRVFTDVPSPPYDAGDLWFNRKEIYICNTTKPEGDSYEENDFGIATKYTGDEKANEVAKNLAENYSTTVQMDLAISKSASEILTSVSANYTTKNEFTNEITALEQQYTTVSVKADGIESTVSTHTTQLGTLTTRVSSAESSITQQADQIVQRVEKSEIISSINQSAEMVKISASKIELEGTVTFSDLDSDTQTKITTATTTASGASSKATSALNRASFHYGTCETAAATAAKAVTLSGFTLYTGAMVSVYFTYANTAASPTLNVNGTGAKSIIANNATITSKYYWRAKDTVTFIFNGSYWVLADTSASSLLVSWCSDNDKTLIDGGKIYTKSIKAASIDVNDLFAQNITATGSITGVTLISQGSEAAEVVKIEGGTFTVGTDTGTHVSIANAGISIVSGSTGLGGIRNNMAGGIEIWNASGKPFAIKDGSNYILTVNKNSSYAGYIEMTYPIICENVDALDIGCRNITAIGNITAKQGSITGKSIKTTAGADLDTINNSKVSIEYKGTSAYTGFYYKFSDGTLICVKTVNVYVALNIAWGGIYESPQINLGDWPHAFVSNPYVSVTVYAPASTTAKKLHAFHEGILELSPTSVGKTYLCRGVSTAANNYWIDIIGIGRWK